MSLETILDIYPIYKNIIKYLSDTDVDILCIAYPIIKSICNYNGYKRKIHIYYDNIYKYISCLQEYERHKIFVKEICAYNMINPFAFLPKSPNKTYSLYNCDLIQNVPNYIVRLNIYTNKVIDLYKFSKECKHIKYLCVFARKIINRRKKLEFIDIKSIKTQKIY